MDKLNFTRKDIKSWQKTSKGQSAFPSLLEDWLIMYDMLRDIAEKCDILQEWLAMCELEDNDDN